MPQKPLATQLGEFVADLRPPIERPLRNVGKLLPKKLSGALVPFGLEEPLRQDDADVGPDMPLVHFLLVQQPPDGIQLAIKRFTLEFCV